MISQLMIFMPFMVCLFWVIIYFLIAPRTSSYHMEIWFLLIAAIYFFTDACYESSLSTPTVLAWTSLIAQIVAPMMLPFAIMFLAELNSSSKRISAELMMWQILPCILFAADIALMAILGFQRSLEFIVKAYDGYPVPGYDDAGYQILHVCLNYVFRALLIVEGIAYIVYINIASVKYKYKISNLVKFLRKKGTLSLKQLEMLNFSMLFFAAVVKIIIPRQTCMEHPYAMGLFGLMTAIIICQICSSGLFSDAEDVSINVMWQALRMHVGEEPSVLPEPVQLQSDPVKAPVQKVSAIPETAAPQREVQPAMESDAFIGSSRYNTAKRMFDAMMMDKAIYLSRGLTASDIASRLNLDKDDLTKLVTYAYGVPFNDYLMQLRINAAKNYILDNPEAHQEDVAQACGFPSASSFNNSFKKVTGMTPRIWTITQGQKKS